MRLFIANIPRDCDEDALKQWLKEQGHSVTFARICRDRATYQSRGFGFIELDGSDAAATIQQLNGQTLGGRVLTVNVAKPKRTDSERATAERLLSGQ